MWYVKFKHLTVYLTLTFFVLYVIATYMYPGGHHLDNAYEGFSWLHNYWCDLTGDIAQNGQANSAKPIAILALIVAAASLGITWYLLPALLGHTKDIILAKWVGILAVICGATVFTSLHGFAIYFGGAFAGLAIAMVLRQLFIQRKFGLLYFGVFTLISMGINITIYSTKLHINALPLLQKFTFVLVFVWFLCLTLMSSQKSH